MYESVVLSIGFFKKQRTQVSSFHSTHFGLPSSQINLLVSEIKSAQSRQIQREQSTQYNFYMHFYPLLSRLPPKQYWIFHGKIDASKALDTKCLARLLGYWRLGNSSIETHCMFGPWRAVNMRKVGDNRSRILAQPSSFAYKNPGQESTIEIRLDIEPRTSFSSLH